MTHAHITVSIYAGATWCLSVALLVRGIWLFDASPTWAMIDIVIALLVYTCHVFLERYERFADEY